MCVRAWLWVWRRSLVRLDLYYADEVEGGMVWRLRSRCAWAWGEGDWGAHIQADDDTTGAWHLLVYYFPYFSSLEVVTQTKCVPDAFG